MSVYVLFHDVQYEGRYLLGVYSTLERAQEAGRAFLQAEDAHVVVVERQLYVVVVERQLDGPASEPLWEDPVWEHGA